MMSILVWVVSGAFLHVAIPQVLLNTSPSAKQHKLNSSNQQESTKPNFKDIKQERCEPLAEVRHGCFTCLCPFTELINPKLCTLKYCNEKGEPIVHKDDVIIGANCKPGAVFRRGTCLKCTCPEKGTIESTHCSYICDEADAIIPQFSKCIPGTIFTYGCNYCVCTDRSTVDRFSCSQTSCNSTSKELKIKGKMNEIKSLTLSNINIYKVCEPGSLLRVRCNLCECNKDGVIAPDSCTVAKCNHLSIGDSCIPGERFKSGCLTCSCPEKGVVETTHCSKKLCKEPSRRLNTLLMEPANGDSCRSGASFKVGCRLCKCPTSGIVDLSVCTDTQTCTKSTFGINRVGFPPVKNECVPQTIFRHECNTCICPSSGKLDLTNCSNRNCSEFKQTISNSEVSATDINGAFVNLTEMPRLGDKCKPHQHYRVRCTVCYCPPNGHFNTAMCVDDACVKKRAQTTGHVTYLTNSLVENENCTPNTTYQNHCSICFCPHDGKVDWGWCTEDDCDSVFIVQSTDGSPSKAESG